MNTPSTIDQIALSCEVKFYALRKSKDGIIASFVLHPSDVPDGLMLAAIGTRFMVALVEIGDDEQPKGGDAKQSEPERTDKPQPRSPTAKAGGASWHEMSPAQQAGILSNDPSFARFMSECHGFTHADVALMVRQHCGVSSRKDILPDNEAGRKWRELVSDYRAWIREPEIVG